MLDTATDLTPIAAIFVALPDLPSPERSLIECAYERANIAHYGQSRNSGEPYVTHCIAVAEILAGIGLDAITVAAGLLHDVVEDTGVTLQDIENEFGPKIAELVDGVTKLKQLPAGVEGIHGDKEMEYLRKMFLAMGSDFRVILIKLADRLHNMRTLDHMPPHKQAQKAKEVMDIYAPLANRLGLWRWKSELEDLAFLYLDPEHYHEIDDQITEKRAERDLYLARITAQIQENFSRAGLKAEVQGRSKHVFSIFRKMERKNLPFSQVYDIRAVRILVDTVPQCYQALGLTHAIFHSIPGEFDDFISSPKENSYRSLHTAVLDKEGYTLEVQIRTRDMHEDAELGIAAHWRAREGRPREGGFEHPLERIRRMMENVRENQQGDDSTANTFVQEVLEHISPERIFAITPKGDIIDLPEGATPIDFAYYVHTEVGHRCRGAKVNGKLVSLDYQIKNSDRVEIITANRGGPNLDWLNDDLAKTTRARSKIRQWFKRRDRENAIAAGREALDRELHKLGMATLPRDEVAQAFNFSNADELMAAIGYGDITPAQVGLCLLEDESSSSASDAADALAGDIERVNGMRLNDTGGLLVTLANCCHPTPGDDIVGYLVQGRGITVHRADCINIINAPKPERLIHVTWPPDDQTAFQVPVVIVAYDREGLMRDIGAALADENISISNVNISTRQNIATFQLTIKIQDLKQLTRVLGKLERLPNVVEAVRRTPDEESKP